MYAKSLQSYLTRWNPLDYNLPGFFVHGILQARTWVGCHALLQGIFLTQGSKLRLLCLLHWQVISLPLAPTGKPNSVLCSDLNGKEIPKRGDIYMHGAESLCYTAETNTALLSNYNPIKLILKRKEKKFLIILSSKSPMQLVTDHHNWYL